ncbi:hypothetical protein QMZ92_33965 [Streptomyces sp. HNM0645]|uniref:hypothetical protein n=1 Tax=Streptomyces sp. HNM0645 TaxID=2782343 RepID=UPI0024B6E238|nr:hypothetical protein [Streptomyces sp. HNM0645]MDI9889205.1 hypothetical protein [Streptomyces sp. HNM0645]
MKNVKYVSIAAGLIMTASAGVASAADGDGFPTPSWKAGVITSNEGVNVRGEPTTNSTLWSTLDAGAVAGFTCKVRGQEVDGNDLWYRLNVDRVRYVTARYVQTRKHIPYCGYKPSLDPVDLQPVTAEEAPMG